MARRDCRSGSACGKDIYGEKPLAYTISEGRAVVDAVNRYGRVWQTGSWQRSQQHFRFACELVRNGRIGEVKTVRVGLPYGNSIQDRGTQPAPVPEGFDYDMWLGPAPWRPYNRAAATGISAGSVTTPAASSPTGPGITAILPTGA